LANTRPATIALDATMNYGVSCELQPLHTCEQGAFQEQNRFRTRVNLQSQESPGTMQLKVLFRHPKRHDLGALIQVSYDTMQEKVAELKRLVAVL